MKVNAEAVFNEVNVTGRKIISTFQEGLETVFGQIRARIEIVSPSTVYDDKTSHDVILQTFGMEYKKITFGNFTYDTTNQPGAANKMPADQIHIQVIAPNKAAKKTEGTADEDMIGTEDDLVYNSGRFCEIEYYKSKFVSKPIQASGLQVSNSDNAGRIKLKIKSPASGEKLDFTFSPLKIKVYYINSRGHLKTVSEYLYIDPATLLMAGETNTDTTSEDNPNKKDFEEMIPSIDEINAYIKEKKNGKLQSVASKAFTNSSISSSVAFCLPSNIFSLIVPENKKLSWKTTAIFSLN